MISRSHGDWMQPAGGSSVGRLVGWSALLALLLGAGVPLIAGLVAAFGHRIPQPNMAADYATALLWAVVLGLSLLLWPIRGGDKRALVIIWVVKVWVALGFMLLYENRYGLDAYMYFEESLRSTAPFDGVGPGRGTDNIIAFSWLQSQVLPASYHAMKLTYAMLGLIGLYVFYRAVVRFMGREEIRWLYGLCLFPSILFWSTILGKDPVVLLGICVYVYGVVGWYRTRRSVMLVPMAAGLWLSMFIRLWLGPILLLPLAVLFWRTFRSFAARVAMVGVAGAGVAVSLLRFRDRFRLATMEDLFETTNAFSRGFEGGSSVGEAVMFTSLGDMVRFAPIGAFTALFRPLPGEIMNPFGLLAGLENLLLLGLLVLALLRIRSARVRDPLVVWGLLLLVTWAGLYGFVSYQNLGAAVRFRLQVLPLLLALLCYVAGVVRGSREDEGIETPPRAGVGG